MAHKRAILEMGTGNDLHGGDYTKAAIRAVQDALHHSSLTFMHALGRDLESMQVHVTIAVREPGAVDCERVKAELPHGQVQVRAVEGGLDILDEERGDKAIIASVAIEVYLEAVT